MNIIKKSLIVVAVLFTIFGLQQSLKQNAQANDSELLTQNKSTAGNELAAYLLADNNTIYNRECASCHFLYSPGLLSSGSWKKIISKNSEHFGNDLKLTKERVDDIIAYLIENSTDKGVMSAEVEDILGLRDKNGEAPIRITKTSYIEDAHSRIDQEIFTRYTQGGFSNCGACHSMR